MNETKLRWKRQNNAAEAVITPLHRGEFNVSYKDLKENSRNAMLYIIMRYKIVFHSVCYELICLWNVKE